MKNAKSQEKIVEEMQERLYELQEGLSAASIEAGALQALVNQFRIKKIEKGLESIEKSRKLDYNKLDGVNMAAMQED